MSRTIKNKRKNKNRHKKTRTNKQGGMFKPNAYDLDKTEEPKSTKVESLDIEEKQQLLQIPEYNIRGEIETLKQDIELLKSKLMQASDSSKQTAIDNGILMLIGLKTIEYIYEIIDPEDNDYLTDEIDIPIFLNKNSDADEFLFRVHDKNKTGGDRPLVIVPNLYLLPEAKKFSLDLHVLSKNIMFVDEDGEEIKEDDTSINEKYPGLFLPIS